MRLKAALAIPSDYDDLARQHVAQWLAADGFEGTGLRGEEPVVLEAADGERADAEGIADADDFTRCEDNKAVSALKRGHDAAKLLDVGGAWGGGDQARDDLA